MRAAVFSDIHGNYEALQAVLLDMEKHHLDKYFCLGDLVGYGPESNEIVSIIQKMDVVTVAGNHERGMFSTGAYDNLNFQVQENNKLVKNQLSPANLNYCCSLPAYYNEGNATFVHGFPPDSVSEYFFEKDDDDLASYFTSSIAKIAFVGHTHRLAGVAWQNNTVQHLQVKEGVVSLGEARYIINVGSVGQPRSKDRRANYIIWDDVADTIEIVCVEYDCRPTIKKIQALGFPGIYASRLKTAGLKK
ncbi:MAG: metallophosphoesterase [Desulfotalea sp.]